MQAVFKRIAEYF